MAMSSLTYMIDSDRRPASNRRPLLKLASADVIISNHCPILGYSQIYSRFFCEIFSTSLFRLGILRDKNYIKILCSEI
jgi:hypothetical protein